MPVCILDLRDTDYVASSQPLQRLNHGVRRFDIGGGNLKPATTGALSPFRTAETYSKIALWGT